MINFESFKWDWFNISHILNHQVSPEEAEEACYNKILVLKSRQNRYYIMGQTDNGRYLTVIVEPRNNKSIRVITARDMYTAERSRINRK